MAKTPKNPKEEFKRLKDHWYKKLAKSGFKDIEKNEDTLFLYSNRFAARQPLEVWQAKAAYYSMAERFLNEYEFPNNLERSIWEYYSNGISIRNIVSLLKKVKISTYRRAVNETILRLEETMKRMYLAGYSDNEH